MLLFCQPRHCPVCPAHCGQAEHSCQHTQLVGSGDPDRVDSVPQSSSTSEVTFSQTPPGSLCYPLFKAPTKLCQSGGRSESPSCRRPISGMDGLDSIHLSSTSPHSKSNQKSKGRTPLPAFDSPKMAGTALVSRAVSRRSSSPKSRSKRSSPAPLGHSTQKPKPPPPSYLCRGVCGY